MSWMAAGQMFGVFFTQNKSKKKFLAANQKLPPGLCVLGYCDTYLSHVDELGEDLRSLLGCVSAEDHQLHPLGDAITHHDRALQSRVVPHRALHHVAAVVQELGQSERSVCLSL